MSPQMIRLLSRAVLRNPPMRKAVPEVRHLRTCYNAGALDASRLRVALFGDSLALSVGTRHTDQTIGGTLARELRTHRGVEVSVHAAFGATSDSLARQVSRLTPTREGAAVVVVIVGGNDVLAPIRLRASARHLARAVEGLRERGWSTVVVTCPEIRRQPALRAWVRPLAARRSKVLARLQTRAALRAGAHTLSLYDTTLLQGVDAATFLAEDGLHPSPAAYRHYLARLLPVVRTACAPGAERTDETPVLPLSRAARIAGQIPGLHCAPAGDGLVALRLPHHPLPPLLPG